MKRFCCALAVLVLSARAVADPLDHGDLLTFATRDGVTQSIFVESPSSSPAWVVVLFGGTPGALHLDATGATTLKVRSRSHQRSPLAYLHRASILHSRLFANFVFEAHMKESIAIV